MACGVIRYVTVDTTLPVLVSMSVTEVVPAVWLAVNPATDPTGKQAAVQVKSLAVTSEFSCVLRVVPEQIGVGWEFSRCGVGLTVTVYG